MNTKLHYWYARGEEKERKRDIAYIKRRFPQTEFEVLPELGTAGDSAETRMVCRHDSPP